MIPIEFSDFQEAVIYVAGPGLAWLLAFAIAGAILLALVIATVGVLRRINRWS